MPRARREPRTGTWARYAAPAAFLLAGTIAVLLVRSALQGPAETPAPTRSTVVATARGRTTTKAKPKPKPRPGGAAAYYTVEAGDTFGTIASKNGTTVAVLESLNPGVKSTSLFIGERIRVK